MTAQDIRVCVGEEMKLAESALEAAEALLGLGLYPDAASRCYYAALHAARALLLTVGIEASSHRAVRTHLARHFVRDGALPASRSKELAQLESLRFAGDYDSSFALGAAELAPEVEKARAFLSDARRLLKEGAWLA